MGTKKWGIILLAVACLILSGNSLVGINEEEGPSVWTYEIAHAKRVPEPDVPIYINDRLAGRGNQFSLHYMVREGNKWKWPAVFALYSSGYIRLVPITSPPTNFGTSAILGPAYWSEGNYYHNPTLEQIRLTGDMEVGRDLMLVANASLGDLDINYEIKINSPTPNMMSCQVNQEATSRQELMLDESHCAKHEGWKLAQLSSMFIDDKFHDADRVHFVGRTRGYTQAELVNSTGFIFHQTDRLGEPWLEMAHFARSGWQGATPSLSIVLDDFALVRNCSPQGRVTETGDPNNDNVGAWINWDAVPLNWIVGQSQTISYQLMARDIPRAR